MKRFMHVTLQVQLKKSGQKSPRVEIEEIGPRMDLKIRRNKIASDDLFKQVGIHVLFANFLGLRCTGRSENYPALKMEQAKNFYDLPLTT